MKEVDYIVVGLGLAGIAFCEELEVHGKSFVAIDGGLPSASRVSGGIYNPVILKRYTLPWRARECMDILPSYYNGLSEKLGQQISDSLPVLRLFSSIEDQNNWFAASGKEGLSRFMEDELSKDARYGLNAPYHYGKVKETGRVNVPLLLDLYRDYLTGKQSFRSEIFDYEKVNVEAKGVFYKDIAAKKIVFAEGFGVKKNPFFNALPLVGNKGEYVTIRAERLKENAAVKSSFFIIPQGNHHYKVGATFNWKEKDAVTTAAARNEILTKLKKILVCDFEVVGQEAGVRPTTGDRRPLLGRHPHYTDLVLFNGLGTRGIMMSPYLAQLLYAHMEEGQRLDDEVSIARFPKKFQVR